MVNDRNEERGSSDEQAFSFDLCAESFAKITLAGFGGALAGMSFARGGRNAAALVGSTVRTTSARRIQHLKESKNTAATNLPLSWAVACMTFAGITELCRITSPTRQILAAVQPGTHLEISSAVETVGNLTLGGTIAGAALRGNIRPNAPPLALATRIGAGMVLGFVAGSAQYGMEYLIHRLEPQESQQQPSQRQDP